MIFDCKFQILGIKTTVGHYIIIFSRNSSCLWLDLVGSNFIFNSLRPGEELMNNMSSYMLFSTVLVSLSQITTTYFKCNYHKWNLLVINRADLRPMRKVPRFAPNQWETVLHCNDVSHWLGAMLESALIDLLMSCSYLTRMRGYQGSSSINGHQSTYIIDWS